MVITFNGLPSITLHNYYITYIEADTTGISLLLKVEDNLEEDTTQFEAANAPLTMAQLRAFYNTRIETTTDFFENPCKVLIIRGIQAIEPDIPTEN